MNAQTRIENLAASMVALNPGVPMEAALEFAEIVHTSPAPRAARAIHASTAAPAPVRVSCPSCGVTGGLPANHKKGNVLTCSRCDAKFKFDPATAKPGMANIGEPVDGAGASLAARVRASRHPIGATEPLADRIRMARLQRGIEASRGRV